MTGLNSLFHVFGIKQLTHIINKKKSKRYNDEWERRWQWFDNLDENCYEHELSRIYKNKTGRELNIHSPKRFTEKIQWRKLYDRDIIYSKLADKYEVRKWVEKKIGSQYLVPLLGVWDNAKDIDFVHLPNSFVLKTNNGSHSLIIVKDKKKLDYSLAKEQLDFWLKHPPTAFTLELHYLDIKPKIIAEEYLLPTHGSSIEDFKFLCFSGEPKYCWIDYDRSTDLRRNVYDMNWNLQQWTVGKKPPIIGDIPKPAFFDDMVELVRKLSSGFEHVRVDMYCVSGRIYFGEMTFTSGGGISPFTPDKMDTIIGALWNTNTVQIDEELVSAF